VSSRTLAILLIVSFALNLFIVGAVAGVGVMLLNSTQAPPARPQPRPGGALMQAAGVLSPDQRDAYRAAVQTANASVSRQAREARVLRRGAWLRLANQPVDVSGITADLDKARELDQQARHVVEARIVAYAADLPQDERTRLAERLSTPQPPNGQQPPAQQRGQAQPQPAQPQAQ
jgi:uncharacterized membrane protein